MLRRRANRLTARAISDAMPACASPREISEWNSDLSTQNLHRQPTLYQPPGLQNDHTVAHSPRLIAIVGDHYAGEAMVAHQGPDQLFDPLLRLFIQGRGGLVEQQHLRPVGERS